MTNLPLYLYCILFAIAIFAPIRVAILSYLVLSAVDFESGSTAIGYLNALKGLVYPVYMLWRLRAYAGHSKLVIAPVAWLLLVSYAALASFWSLFPLAAAKLVGEMVGSFLICMFLMRATKGGLLTPFAALPVTIGILILAFIRQFFAISIGDTPDRFTAFVSAQSFASLLAALYCLALCSKTLPNRLRVAVCTATGLALFFDGSRLWLIGTTVATLIALVASEAKTWIKIFGFAAMVFTGVTIVSAGQSVFNLLSQGAQRYRIASAIKALVEGDEGSSSLGTYNLRKRLDSRGMRMVRQGSVLEIAFGHGTSNGRLIRGNLNRGIGDPNRAVHNEWLRVLYEWGITGLTIWLFFMASVMIFAYQGVRQDRFGFAKPLFIYVPAFAIGLAGENILAGADHAVNIGLILLIAIASMAHRRKVRYRLDTRLDEGLQEVLGTVEQAIK